MELPTRKQIRLQKYDYSQNGAYFVTICTKDKHEILSKIDVGDGVLDVPIIKLSDYGIIAKKQIEEMKSIYTYLDIDKYTIMPNHIHLIITIDGVNGTSRTPSPTNAIIPKFVSTLKRMSNKKIGFSVWQRSYHDHIIRNEHEYQKIWQYIDTNPIKWELDKYYTN